MRGNVDTARVAVRLQRRQKYALGPALHALRALISAGLEEEAAARATEYAQNFSAPAAAGAALYRLAEDAPIHQFNAEQRIIAEGEAADALFVVVRGKVRVERRRAGLLARLSIGQSFGEIALFAQTPRTATVLADGGASVLEISRARLDALQAEIPALGDVLRRVHRDRLLSQFVSEDSLFGSLNRTERHALFSRFDPIADKPGQLLLCQGQTGRSFSVLISGQVKVWQAGLGGGVSTLATLGPGDFFGEIALLKNVPITANVQALTPVSRLVLDRRHFHQVMGAHPEQHRRLEAVAQARLGGENPSGESARSGRPVQPDDFAMTCPVCAYEQPQCPICVSCGVSIAAAREALRSDATPLPIGPS